jgi:hypothetical protein
VLSSTDASCVSPRPIEGAFAIACLVEVLVPGTIQFLAYSISSLGRIRVTVR